MKEEDTSLVHEKPDKRGIGSPHASKGWKVGPELEHYGFYCICMMEIQGECISDAAVTGFLQ
jgi:hypothetical protein